MVVEELIYQVSWNLVQKKKIQIDLNVSDWLKTAWRTESVMTNGNVG